VEELSLQDLDDLWPEVERAVDATPGIDPWCSGPDWSVPVASGFAPDAERLLLTNDERTGFALFTVYHAADEVPLLSGLEPLWGFGSPIFGPAAIGPPGNSFTDAAARALSARPDWQVLYIPGLPMVTEDGDPEHRRVTVGIAGALSTLGRLRLSEGITRQLADLTDGHDGWLARRSPRFRRNLRQAHARAESKGLTIVDASEDPDLFDRIMTIEYQSWKGQEGSGITSPEMTVMYRLMVERLRARKRLLAYVATIDERDVGYILGGVRGRRYRGLQLSYTEDASALSVGNLLQHHQLLELDRLNLADIYDLGMDFDYKRRWADRTETSLALIVDRR
jgi:CelD/BcsL family acetyltransferase involved in cellulose biosynthesis